MEQSAVREELSNSECEEFPYRSQDTEYFERNAPRGNMRYVQANGAVYLQWKDKRVVTMLSTYHKATDNVVIARNTKNSSMLS